MRTQNQKLEEPKTSVRRDFFLRKQARKHRVFDL